MGINDDVELLTADQERGLAAEIEVGVFASHAVATGLRPGGASLDELNDLVTRGDEARQRFFLANVPLVRQRATHWSRRSGVPGEELFQEGCVGLGEAIRRFDWARGYRFSTFAFPLVEGWVARHAQTRCGAIDLSRYQVRMLARIRRATDQLTQMLGRWPRTDKIADHLGVGVSVVRSALERGSGIPVVLDDDLMVAGSASGVAEGSCSEGVTHGLDVSWLDLLGDRERTILAARFGLGAPGRSRNQLAQTMGVSVSTIRREELRALGMARRVLAALDGDGRMEQWHHFLHAS